MRFCELLDAVRRQPMEFSIPAGWAQGRASFGGLVAALQCGAVRARVPADRPVRSLAITFVGPVEPEVPVVLKSMFCVKARRSARCWAGRCRRGRW